MSTKLTEASELIDYLDKKLETFPNASKEFWEVYDELKVLVLEGIHLALKEGDDVTATRFRELSDGLKNRAPSGYWK
ncbi:MAG: hypothetical protein ACW98Y_10565 [Candidatus Thorarchaeota archaeon]|jgi:hypothetical protein